VLNTQLEAVADISARANTVPASKFADFVQNFEKTDADRTIAIPLYKDLYENLESSSAVCRGNFAYRNSVVRNLGSQWSTEIHNNESGSGSRLMGFSS
jgi:hypothetical protein